MLRASMRRARVTRKEKLTGVEPARHGTLCVRFSLEPGVPDTYHTLWSALPTAAEKKGFKKNLMESGQRSGQDTNFFIQKKILTFTYWLSTFKILLICYHQVNVVPWYRNMIQRPH